MVLKGFRKWVTDLLQPSTEHGPAITVTKPLWIDCYHNYDSHLERVIP